MSGCPYCGSTLRDIWGNVAHVQGCKALKSTSATTTEIETEEKKYIALLEKKLAEAFNEILILENPAISKVRCSEMVEVLMLAVKFAHDNSQNHVPEER